MLLPKSFRLPALLLSLLALSACSGGGGGGGGSGSSAPPGPTYTLSGSIVLPGTSAVDSDTNDPLQAGWASNDTAASAQAITTPLQLLGSLNTAGTGPAGRTYAAGDEWDVLAATLTAGQVIELNFASSFPGSDIDLVLIDADTSTVVGSSQAITSNRECIALSRSGNYYIIPYIYTGEAPSYPIKGAALYTLRIGAVNDGTSCSNTASSTELFVPGQVVARKISKALPAGFADGMRAASTPDSQPGPRLLEVPEASMQTRSNPLFAQTSTDLRDAAIHRAMGTLKHAKALQASGAYAYVEPNYRVALLANYSPDDPSYLPQRWHFEQINQPAAMDLILAQGGITRPRPIVAVIDSGIVSDHPDLAAQIVDGYSFVAGAGGTNVAGADDPSSVSYCSTKACWHGSHVAGIVAAISDNGEYGAGVAKMAQIMPLRVFRQDYSSSTTYDIFQAIRYAARLSNDSGSLPARRADIINLSIGAAGACSAGFADAINQARAQNVILVAAAGNSASAVGQPANCGGVISVGALDADKQRTFYSNFGAALTLSAPGGDPTQSTTGTGYPDSIYSTLATFHGSTRTPSFGPMQGTSMAAPHVAGVMALMRYIHPGITPAQIDTLITTARLTDDIGSAGRDDLTGQGLINANKAVSEALSLSAGSSLAGSVFASPASISFGSTTTSATLTLGITATTSEVVTGITASSPSITITPIAPDPVSGLGDYTISVDRSLLPTGFNYPELTVTTSTRSFKVPLSVVKLSASSSAQATFGSVWVKATSTSSGAVLGLARFSVSNGRYAWSLSGIPAGSINLIASTDLNNNRILCEQGEACGDHPGNNQPLQVTGSMSGLDFSIAPTLSTGATATP